MLLAAMAAPCRGQDTALVQPSLGVLPRSSPIESERAKTTCPLVLGDHRDHLLAASVPQDSTSMTCTVERVDSLRDAVGLRWRVVKYVTLYVFPADSLKRRFQAGATTDTSEVLDVVIYSVERGDSLWRAEWRGWAERAMIREVDVSLGVHSGMALFSIVSCVNGTGGCDQHFVGRTAGTWVPLNESYRVELQRRFGGNPFWKGIVVDVNTLRGTIPLYSNGDANCCASRNLGLALKLEGVKLVVGIAKAYRVASP
jgi:hypothetical protein